MARGVFRASLQEFLSTGTLGPVAIGVPMQVVGEHLGPPKYWSFWSSGIPFFWGYQYLEINFANRAPYRVEAVRLVRADVFEGISVSLAPRLRLALVGFDGRMPPSEFMRRCEWSGNPPEIAFQLVAGEVQLRLGFYPVDMLYVLKDADADELDGHAAFRDVDWKRLVRFFEDRATLHSMEALSRTGWKRRHWQAPTMRVSAEDYVHCIKNHVP